MDTPAPTGTSDKARLFSFEKISGRAGHRDPQQARQQLSVLWSRLGGTEADLEAIEEHDPSGWQFLMRYVADGPLSIQWYDSRRPKLEQKQRRYNWLLLGMALLLFLLAFLLPFQPLLLALSDDITVRDAVEQTGLIDVAALMGVVGTGATVAMRISSQVARYRTQAASFHKASAELKEKLYLLEDDWLSRDLLDPKSKESGKPELDPKFAAAIRQAIGTAQSILARERDEYFDTLTVDVNALTDNVREATDQLASKVVYRRERIDQQTQRRQQLDEKSAEARLSMLKAQAKIEELEAELASASEDAKVDLKLLIREQRLAKREAEEEHKHLEERRDALFNLS